MAPGRKQKAAGRVTPSQPSRKGSGHVHSRPDSTALPIELQQSILDVFRRAFPLDQVLDLKAVIQDVKGHLFLRDFDTAFAKPEYLDAYALRWSASRALGYSDILLGGDLQKIWLAETSSTSHAPDQSLSSSASRVACIGGGGGAEVAACAAAAKAFSLPKMEVHAIDIADWSTCLAKLEKAFCTPAQLSPYASESAKAANKPFVESDRFNARFSRHDVLSVDEGQLGGLFGGVKLCTIMFTLNELFASSISRATAFLLALTDAMEPGSWLLVVDSPGSYSEVKMGTGQGDESKTRQYPMKWLLEHALLEVAGKDEKKGISGGKKWKRHVSDDSRWFRLNPSLRYPIELENMRYQIHLYQRLRPGDGDEDE